MNSKLYDKIATVILYIISAFIVLLFVLFVGYILYQGRESLIYHF